eukprot:350688-Chlamydomonas_euryale.AAC.5
MQARTARQCGNQAAEQFRPSVQVKKNGWSKVWSGGLSRDMFCCGCCSTLLPTAAIGIRTLPPMTGACDSERCRWTPMRR